jgi:hypothetical protein
MNPTVSRFSHGSRWGSRLARGWRLKVWRLLSERVHSLKSSVGTNGKKCCAIGRVHGDCTRGRHERTVDPQAPTGQSSREVAGRVTTRLVDR